MFKIIYWGGPKDGAEEHCVVEPELEQYCMTSETPMMSSYEFETTIKDSIHRSVAYSKYVLKPVDKTTYKYEFSGFL